jgi:hypothetical protein
MGRSVLVDTGFLVALLSRSDRHHGWAATLAPRFAPPWITCEAVLSEGFHLLGAHGVGEERVQRLRDDLGTAGLDSRPIPLHAAGGDVRRGHTGSDQPGNPQRLLTSFSLLSIGRTGKHQTHR